MPPVRSVAGMRDLLPAEMATWTRLVREAAELAAQRGYSPLVTPVIEHTELFSHGVGEGTDVVEKEMYTFKDRGDRSLTLRPEATASAVRAYFEGGLNQGPQPARLWYEGPMFRYDRPQKGRYRSFRQFGVEAIGDDAPGLDVEVIELSGAWLRACGVAEFTLEVNSIGDAKCRPAYRKALQDYYRPHLSELCEDDRRRFETNPLRLLDCKNPKCVPLQAGAPRTIDHLCEECADHHRAVLGLLDALGITYNQNDRLVRGLDYYTRTTFEFWDPGHGGQQNALGGGGRYDGLAETLGFPSTPGVGFAMGEDRVVLSLQERGRAEPESLVEVSVVPAAEASEAAALQLAARLRDAGIRVVVQHGRRSLKAQMRQAQKLGVAAVLILGEDEMASGRVAVRDMARAEQSVVHQAGVVTAVEQILGARMPVVGQA
ncbi:MAG TPA: histidine--tRNA ligase [Candidatus Dormibacteraeota bacterium]|nr:histidine--tRNA ligase [Candidatus Dormibacteraeota bacterium]